MVGVANSFDRRIPREDIVLAWISSKIFGKLSPSHVHRSRRERQPANGAMTRGLRCNDASEDIRIAAVAFESRAGIMVTDGNAVILRVNHAFTELTGYTAGDVIGSKPSVLSSGRHDRSFYGRMWAALKRDGYWQGEIWNRRKDGTVLAEWLTISAVAAAAGQVSHYVGTFYDITEVKDPEAEVHRLAYYDPLTQIGNRRFLQDRLEQALAATDRTNRFGAVLVINIDDFKAINDTRGHSVGDRLLASFAVRLQALVRARDTVTRAGGDEFVVVLEDLSQSNRDAEAAARRIAEGLGKSIADPFRISGHEYFLTASIGVALFRAPDAIDDLLARADLAVHQAKGIGRDTLCFFDPEIRARVAERSALELDLRRAIQTGQMILLFQPQVNEAGVVIGAEALLRWEHPQQGRLTPDRFIGLAEESGLIDPLGQWVLDNACEQLSIWGPMLADRQFQLAVNVSARQFRQPDFVEQVIRSVKARRIKPSLIKLELTESLVLNDVPDAISKMQILKSLGFSFSMDDFGTGYSCLSYLAQLPLDQLKIDRSFVSNLLSSRNDAVIAKTIITMGRSLELHVIAEGVEDEAQRNFLLHNGCQAFQGYWVARPLDADAFASFVANQP